MKRIKIILGLVLFASVSTFAQSPRIKLNQITKDTVKGSVLISSPSDSGMVYSRDFYIAYGLTDTVLILYGDTISGGGGLSSVLSDGVTITGNGTSGNELKVDTLLIATIKALNDSLATISASTTPDGLTITGDGSVGNPLKVDTATVISTIQGLVDTLTNRNYLAVSQLTDTLNANTRGFLTSEVDGSITNEIQNISTSGAAGNITLSNGGGTLNLNVNDADASTTNEGSLTVGAGTASTSVISSNTNGSTDVTLEAGTNVTLTENIGTNTITIAATGGGTSYNNISETADTLYIAKYLDVDTSTLYVDATANKVGIGTPTPTDPLTVDGYARFNVSPESQYLLRERGTAGSITLQNQVSGNGFLTFTTKDADEGDYVGFEFYPYYQTMLDNSGAYSRLLFFFDKVNPDSYYMVSHSYLYPKKKLHLGIGLGTNDLVIDTLGNVGIGTSSPSVQLELSTDGAKKLTTTTWQTGSDIRIKKNIVPYTKGLSEILQLEPIEYELNGKANTIDGAKGVGLIAQEVQPIVPEAVITYQGKLNETDENLSNLYNITTHPFFFMFINGFKEQQTIIETQATEIDQLKTLITDLTNRLIILENK